MINFYAPCNTLGFGVHAYNTMKAYHQHCNNDISLIPPFGRTQWQDDYVTEWLKNRKKISKSDTGIMIFNEPFLSQFSGAKRIGFPVFEMEKFDKYSLPMMKTCDWILTPSKWGKDVLENNGIKDVDIVPEGYDPEIFYPDYSLEYKLNRIEERGLTFIHVGKFEERKGTKDIFTTFIRAFQDSKKRVSLLAYVGNIFNPNWKKEIKTFLGCYAHEANNGDVIYQKGNVTIRVLTLQDLSFKSMANMYRSADFGIWLSRGEGWNLTLMECIACGTPAITTTWTGMSEYLHDYPEELKLNDHDTELANDGFWFKGDRGNWRKPKLDQVYAVLKAIEADPEKYLWLEGKCTQAIEKFTWENAAKKLEKVLKRLGAAI